MIKELMHDPIFLAGKSEVATKEDLQVAGYADGVQRKLRRNGGKYDRCAQAHYRLS